MFDQERTPSKQPHLRLTSRNYMTFPPISILKFKSNKTQPAGFLNENPAQCFTAMTRIGKFNPLKPLGKRSGMWVDKFAHSGTQTCGSVCTILNYQIPQHSGRISIPPPELCCNVEIIHPLQHFLKLFITCSSFCMQPNTCTRITGT